MQFSFRVRLFSCFSPTYSWSSLMIVSTVVLHVHDLQLSTVVLISVWSSVFYSHTFRPPRSTTGRLCPYKSWPMRVKLWRQRWVDMMLFLANIQSNSVVSIFLFSSLWHHKPMSTSCAKCVGTTALASSFECSDQPVPAWSSQVWFFFSYPGLSRIRKVFICKEFSCCFLSRKYKCTSAWCCHLRLFMLVLNCPQSQQQINLSFWRLLHVDIRTERVQLQICP